MQNFNLFWFRRDLRIEDNLAFATATKNGVCLPIFILDPYFYENWSEIGQRRVVFMLQSLYDLQLEIKNRLGLEMLIFYDSPKSVFSTIKSLLAEKFGSQDFGMNLYFNRDRQIIYGRQRDGEILSWAKENGVKAFVGSSSFLILDESQMDSWTKEYYKYQSSDYHFLDTVLKNGFRNGRKDRSADGSENVTENVTENSLWESQFWQKLKHISCDQIQTFEKKYPKYKTTQKNPTNSLLEEFSNNITKPGELIDFRGGASQAQSKLKSFLKDRYQGYHWKLSYPELSLKGATSHLSPYIMWGCISTRQVYNKVWQKLKDQKSQDQKSPNDQTPGGKTEENKYKLSLNAFLERLRWRENFTQKLYLHPEYAIKNRHAKFDQLYTWEMSPEKEILWEAFCSGKTGFVLVDASIRQLISIGWLNFRMRAMLATFLTINMGISWHYGAQFFMNHLVDGDIAINHWQWQMQAGVTNPLSKTFRIYSPQKNLTEKDPQLKFVRLWLPELASVSDYDILNNQIDTPLYPKPILDINKTRLENGKKVSQIRKAVAERIMSKLNSGNMDSPNW